MALYKSGISSMLAASRILHVACSDLIRLAEIYQ